MVPPSWLLPPSCSRCSFSPTPASPRRRAAACSPVAPGRPRGGTLQRWWGSQVAEPRCNRSRDLWVRITGREKRRCAFHSKPELRLSSHVKYPVLGLPTCLPGCWRLPVLWGGGSLPFCVVPSPSIKKSGSGHLYLPLVPLWENPCSTLASRVEHMGRNPLAFPLRHFLHSQTVCAVHSGGRRWHLVQMCLKD